MDNQQNTVTLFFTLQYHGNSHYGPIRSGQMRPDPIIPPLSTLTSFLRGVNGGSTESGGNKDADWSTHSKIPPAAHLPVASYWLPTSIKKGRKKKKKKPRASPSPIGHHSLGGKGCFPPALPLVSFDNMPTVSHSAAANQVAVQYLWNFQELQKRKEKKNKQEKNEDEQGDQPVR